MVSQLVAAVCHQGPTFSVKECFPLPGTTPLNLGLLTLLYFHQVLGGCVLSLVCVLAPAVLLPPAKLI